jgi:hypothetical protein
MIVMDFTPGIAAKVPMPKLSITRDFDPADRLGRVDPGIGPAVIEFGGIRLFADAGRIRDNQEDTLKFFISLSFFAEQICRSLF